MPKRFILYCAHWFQEHVLIFLSAAFLIAAFPKTDLWIFSWIGLVPLLLSIEGKPLFSAFRRAYLCGFIFFVGTLYWIVHVTLPGMIVLCMYLALYFGLFGFFASYFSSTRSSLKVILYPSLWVGLEFIRAHALTGFDWGSLGYSQYKNFPIIQVADITGMYGVSFLIAMVNVFLYEIIRGKREDRRWKSGSLVKSGVIILCLIIFVLVYGSFKLHKPSSSKIVSIAVVQANIPQELKWRESAWPMIMDKYNRLTDDAAAQRPSLIVWPETSFPGYLWDDRGLFGELQASVKGWDIPLLVGAVTHQEKDYYNSALFLSREGKLEKQYDKVHLVMFGEYIPLRKYLPFLSYLVPIGDFRAGNEYTIFKLTDREKRELVRFSTLICFEDTVSSLARRQVLEGSQLLINITNDAWFKDSKEPFMHLQSSVFRAVENRRSVVRAANTGVSAFISPQGRIGERVYDSQKKTTYVSGIAKADVEINDEMSFYTKMGDIFTYLCFGCILGIFLRRISK